MLHTRSRRIFVAFMLALALILLVIALGGTESAAGGDLPPRPTPSPTPIPATPTATPLPAPTAVPAAPINGAAIRLQTSTSAPGAWTVVEWQNEQGKWYEVAGWRGHLDEGNADMKTWWVYPTNYGEGPFRWVLYSSQDGARLAASAPFNLPTRNLQVVSTAVELP